MKKYIVTILMTCFFQTSVNAVEIKSCQTQKCIDYFNDFKKYARSGYADAHVTLGEFFLHGYGTDVDLELALKNFRKGARYGSFEGQYRAGLMYLEIDEFKDVDQGIKYLKMAARNKHAVSAYLLGMIYSNGQFIEADFEEADKWLTKSYESRNITAIKQINNFAKSEHFSIANYPTLGELLADTDQQTEQLFTRADSENIETITILAPDLVTILEEQLHTFKNTNPQRFAVTTGTKISNRTCEYLLSCGTVDKTEFRRMQHYTNFPSPFIP